MTAAKRQPKPENTNGQNVDEPADRSVDFLGDTPTLFPDLDDDDLNDENLDVQSSNDVDETDGFADVFGFEDADIDDEADDEDDEADEDADDIDDDDIGEDLVVHDDEDDLDDIEQENDDFDDVEQMTPLSAKQDFRPSSGRAGLVDEPDENDDDIEDVDEILNPISNPIDEDSVDNMNDDDVDDQANEFTDANEDKKIGIDPEEFGAESEEDIQSAAEILQERGLLGLGVEEDTGNGTDRTQQFPFGLDQEVNGADPNVDANIVLSDDDDDEEEQQQQAFDLPKPKTDPKTSRSRAVGPTTSTRKRSMSALLDDNGDELQLGLDDTDDLDDADILGDDDENGEENGELEYPDMEDEEEGSIGLTSQSKFGRVWELNEDTYVTITEPGESYGYELDMEDQEDQDMSTMRRGKQGGWSGGLASYPASELQEGSREWIARRSYEIMTKTSYKGLLHWCKWHEDPPPEIKELYPENTPAVTPLTPLGVCILDTSPPPAAVTLIGRSDDAVDEYENDEEDIDDFFDMDDEIEDVEISAEDKKPTARTKRKLWRGNVQNESDDSEDANVDKTKGIVEVDSTDEVLGTGMANERKAEVEDAASKREEEQLMLESKLKFPCKYKFRVKGDVGEEFVISLKQTAEHVLGKRIVSSAITAEPAEDSQLVTINVKVDSARQVTEVYDALRSNPSVKFSYG